MMKRRIERGLYSMDGVQLLADRLVAGISLMLAPSRVGGRCAAEPCLKNEDYAALLRRDGLSECGENLCARSMIGSSGSESSPFITYPSTSHRICPGTSE
jgi:hypothetical protein